MRLLVREKNRRYMEWLITGKKEEKFPEIKLSFRDFSAAEQAVPRYHSMIMPAIIEIFVHDYCPRCEFAEKILDKLINLEYSPYVKLYRRVASRPLLLFLPGGETKILAGYVGNTPITVREGVFRVLKDWSADLCAHTITAYWSDERGVVDFPITRIWDGNMVLRKVIVGVDKEEEGMGYELEIRRTLAEITGIRNPGREEELIAKILEKIEKTKRPWWNVKKYRWGRKEGKS